MTFTILETAGVSLVCSLVVGIAIKIWADQNYARGRDVEAKISLERQERKDAILRIEAQSIENIANSGIGEIKADIKALTHMMRLVCEKLDISTREQLEIASKSGGDL